MKKILARLLLCLACLPAFGQQPEIDSLRQQVNQATDDTRRVAALYNLAQGYILENHDSSFAISLRGLDLARKIRYRHGEMMGHSAIGNIFSLKGNYPEALRSQLQALKIAEEEKNLQWEAEIAMSIAGVYFFQKDYDQALAYMRRSKLLGEKLNNREIVQSALENTGAVYVISQRYDSALIYTQLAYSKAIELKAPVYNMLLNLGHVYAGKEQYGLSLEHFRSALPEIDKEGNAYYRCEAMLGMANVFEKTGRSDSAQWYATESYLLARERDYVQPLLDASNYLSTFYKKRKNLDSAFFYSEEAKAANDSLFSQQKFNQLQSLTISEQLRQKEKEEQERLAKEERTHNLQYAAIAIGIIVFIIVFLLLSHSIIVNKNVIRFLAALSLLILFEFINLLIHPFLVGITHHSPILLLAALVCIAAMLIPIHHKLEHWMTERLIEKNKRIRLASAKRTIAELEGGAAQAGS
jgi:tetratricopeptide (TPR) repeat protein